MQLTQLLLASLCFAVGGLFMKWSAGATRLVPTIAFLVLFLIGALLQGLAMRHADLGVVYIAVLGFEAALATFFSIAVLHEHWSLLRMAAVVMIAGGVVLLRSTS